MIFTFDRGGMVGNVHQARKYKVENNHPVLIWSEDQDWDYDKGQFHCIVKERNGNDMVIVRNEWGGSYDSTKPPCELPMSLFREKDK